MSNNSEQFNPVLLEFKSVINGGIEVGKLARYDFGELDLFSRLFMAHLERTGDGNEAVLECFWKQLPENGPHVEAIVALKDLSLHPLKYSDIVYSCHQPIESQMKLPEKGVYLLHDDVVKGKKVLILSQLFDGYPLQKDQAILRKPLVNS